MRKCGSLPTYMRMTSRMTRLSAEDFPEARQASARSSEDGDVLVGKAVRARVAKVKPLRMPFGKRRERRFAGYSPPP